jgi:hypothetical protein
MMLHKGYSSRTFVRGILGIMLLSLAFDMAEGAQKNRKKPVSRTKAAAAVPRATSRIIGTPVVLVTKNGDKIAGTLLDITPFSVKIRADNLDSFQTLDTLASITFGPNVANTGRAPSGSGPVSPEFSRDAEGVIAGFLRVVADTRSGIGYAEYGGQLTELRRSAERFIARYSGSESGSEARIVANLAGALTDFTWARTVWTLGFSRTGQGTVSESDSPAISDAINLYPDLGKSAANGTKLSVDKLVGGLWRRAGEKVDRARSMMGQGR